MVELSIGVTAAVIMILLWIGVAVGVVLSALLSMSSDCSPPDDYSQDYGPRND